MSRKNIPLLHEVIPYIDILNNLLEKAMVDRTLHVTVRSAAAQGFRVLNKYYAKSDDSIMYRIAMSALFLFSSYFIILIIILVLHPRYKLAYFSKAQWEKSWIDTARDILESEYDTQYRTDDSMETANSVSAIYYTIYIG